MYETCDVVVVLFHVYVLWVYTVAKLEKKFTGNL